MKKIVEIVCLVAVAFFALNMDSQSKRSDSLEPVFAPLQEGQGSFRADIYDGSKSVYVKDLSFFGVTSLGRIKSERDDSVSEFDLSELNQVEIDNPHFDSKRFSDQIFTKITIQTRPLGNAKKGSTVSDLLVPRNIIVCGKEYETGLKRAWFVSKIDKIVVHHNDYKRANYPPKEYTTKVKEKKKEEKKAIESSYLVAVSKDQGKNDNEKEVIVSERGISNEKKEEGIVATFQTLIYAFYDFVASLFSSIIGLFR